MLPVSVFLCDSLTRLQQSNMDRILRPRLDSEKGFTVRHWPKMMLVAINLPMIPFWYSLPSIGPAVWTDFQDMKGAHATGPFSQIVTSLLNKCLGLLATTLLMAGTDALLDLYILFTNSVRAARLRRAIFWAVQSMYKTGEILVWITGVSTVDLSWWFFRLSNLKQLNGLSSKELTLTRKVFETIIANQLAEDVKTLAMTAAVVSWGGMARQLAWDIWTNTYVQIAVIGWVLHVLIMDLQGEPRTWWGGCLKEEKRYEETAARTSNEKTRPDPKT